MATAAAIAEGRALIGPIERGTRLTVEQITELRRWAIRHRIARRASDGRLRIGGEVLGAFKRVIGRWPRPSEMLHIFGDVVIYRAKYEIVGLSIDDWRRFDPRPGPSRGFAQALYNLTQGDILYIWVKPNNGKVVVVVYARNPDAIPGIQDALFKVMRDARLATPDAGGLRLVGRILQTSLKGLSAAARADASVTIPQYTSRPLRIRSR